jgi:uncharacterized Zn-finger protein
MRMRMLESLPALPTCSESKMNVPRWKADGIGIFKGQWSYEMIVDWRNNFQKKVNKLAGASYLQFTCSVWLDKAKRLSPTTDSNKSVSTERKNVFPYLDMEMSWSNNDELNFRVHLKPNQKLKYLNKVHYAKSRALFEDCCKIEIII